MINTIKKLVYDKCRNNNFFLDQSFFDQHILITAFYAGLLGKTLDADNEIIELSAYLHDISAVDDFNTLPEHPAVSTGIAEKILLDKNFDKVKIKAIKKCIVSHGSPLQLTEGSKEQICLSNADAMALIAKPVYWLFFTYNIKKLNFKDGKEWLINRMSNSYSKLIDPAKNIIKNTYKENIKILEEK